MSVHRASRMMLGAFERAPKTRSVSFNLMLEKGFIYPAGKGIFSMLPIGQRVVDKLVRIIEKELNDIGGFKLQMPLLGARELWMKAGRWNQFGPEMLHLKDRNGREFCLQPTAEEMVTQIVANFGILRRTAFPLLLYQTGQKYRDEMNARFGLLRSREFIMNDLYSFDLSQDDALKTYNLVSDVYVRIFRDLLKLDIRIVRADCGHIGGVASHEYHLLSDSGEDSIHFCEKCKTGVNSVLARRGEKPCPNCTEECVSVIPSVEVGHTFQLGDQFSKPFGAFHLSKPLIMGCYGLGIGRIIAATIDLLSPRGESSIRLANKIVPFKIAVIPPSRSTHGTGAAEFAESLINQLALTPQLNDEVFVDDRTDYSVGKRIVFAASLGIPHIIVIGSFTARSLESQPRLEYFTVEPCKKGPIEMDYLSHEQLFDIVKGL